MKPILLVALGKDAHLGLEALLENLRSSAHGRGITWKNQAQFRYARIAVLNLDAGPLRSDALDSAATEFRRARSSGRDRELPDPELWRAAGAPEPDFDQRYGDRRSYGLLFLREAIREAQRGGEPLIRLPDGPEGLETGAVIVCGDPLNGGLTELRAHLGHHSMPEEVRRCPWDLFVLPPDTAGPERARVGGLLAELGEQRGEPGTAFRHRFLVPGRAGAGLETMRLLLTTRWRNEPAERTLLVAGERRDLTEEVEGVTARKAVSLALDRVGRAIERRRGKAPDLEAARAEHRRVSVEAGAARDRMVADARQEYERELEGLRSEQERAEARQEEQEETLRSRLDHDHQVHVRQGQEADRRRDELEAELGRWSEQEETRERQRRLASLEARESEEAEQRAARREKLEADLDLAEVKWQLTAERAGVLEAERTRLEAELQEALRSLEGRAAELREEADDGRRCAEAARETARRAREVLLPGY